MQTLDELHERLSGLIDKAIATASEEEPWPAYYRIRGAEIESVLKAAAVKKAGKVLEVGCGNGFVSYLFSSISNEVVATDLYSRNSKTHTVGIDITNRFFDKLDVDNIRLCSCSVESMPFKDNTFDIIFSSYVLQYLNDRSLALKELKRVVKKDGIIILMLPNFIERIYAFFQFYLYLFIKLMNMLTAELSARRGAGKEADAVKKDIARFRDNYKYFPFPGPHGAYKNSAIEMIRHIPFNWNKEFRESGFKIEKSFTTTFSPYPLFLTVSARLEAVIAALLGPFTRYFSTKPVIKYLGYNYCVILKR